MAEAAESLVNVLIVGRSGNGKSSIGNFILRGEKFEVSTLGEKNKCNSEPINGNGFSVIDCSCIKDAEEISQNDFKEAKEAIRNFKRIDAILFVMKYGIRYTQQEQHAVERLKQIFGERVFEDWVIITFSYGDNFDKDAKEMENNLDKDAKEHEDRFEKWCKAQAGKVHELFKEVKYRIVIFNNKADYSERCRSVDQIKNFIVSLRERNNQLKLQTSEIKIKQSSTKESCTNKAQDKKHKVKKSTAKQKFDDKIQSLASFFGRKPKEEKKFDSIVYKKNKKEF